MIRGAARLNQDSTGILPKKNAQFLRIPWLLQDVFGDHVVAGGLQRLNLTRVSGAAGLLLKDHCRHDIPM
ncbi:hypothetical protein XI09_07570 [Bradyrhizobium sp. CCBAU 11386]|nr:hypothetical protein [Bradyrhizobium sp. CCBAU 11386]MDA9537626.1 hypothetical protein [Bradyrhizobium sp. CCBAU 21362]